jgi:predicted phage terminase large subunit-like protein
MSVALAHLASAIPQALVDRALVDRAPESLHAFVRLAFRHVEPRTEFVDGRLVHVLCEYLEAVTAGEIKRLVVNVPPGFMKSLLVGVFWPAWEWISKPDMRTLYASYDPSLTLRDAKRTLELVSSQWYIERWGRVLRGNRQPYGDYWTTQGGNRFSTSIKGKGTGRHFHRHVVDDPIKPRDAQGGAHCSEASLDEVSQWWDQTIATRTSDWKALSRVIAMQRLHMKDLAGHALATGDYVHVCLPMHASAHACPVTVPHRCNADWREDGALLWPERCGDVEVKRLEKELGSEAAVSAQLEQRPTPKGGLVFDEKSFRYWHPQGATILDPNGRPCLAAPHLDAGVMTQSWDMTFADTAGSHAVAGTLWQGIGTSLYLHHAIIRRMSFIVACKAVLDMSRDWPRSSRKLIENKANGPACESVLRDKVGGIVLVEPRGGKLVRATATTTYFEQGQIIFPHPSIASWVNEGIRQLTRFPFGGEDDFVDSLTQAVTDYFERRNRFWQALDKVDL